MAFTGKCQYYLSLFLYVRFHLLFSCFLCIFNSFLSLFLRVLQSLVQQFLGNISYKYTLLYIIIKDTCIFSLGLHLTPIADGKGRCHLIEEIFVSLLIKHIRLWVSCPMQKILEPYAKLQYIHKYLPIIIVIYSFILFIFFFYSL